MSLFGPPDVDRLKAKGNVAGLIGALRYQKDFGASPRAAARALGEIRDPRAVEPLIAALAGRSLRREAVEALGQIGDARAVKPLVAALSDPDPSVRKVAGEALAHIGPPAAGFLTAMLNDQSREVCRLAAEALVQIGPRAVEPLIAALRHQSPGVRGAAADTLGKIGDPQAVEPLITALKDSVEDDMRCRAAEALGKIGDPRAVEPLVVSLGDQGKYVPGTAAEALGKIGDPRAVEPLIAALNEGKVLCSAAAEALGKIGDPRAVEPLVIALNDPMRFVREAAAEALDRLAWSPDRNEAGAAYWAARGKWDRCVDIGVPAVEPLVAALRDGPEWAAAAEALGKIGDPRAVEPLVAVMRTILTERLSEPTDENDWLHDRDGEVCRAAAKALGRIGDARAVAPLIAAVEAGRAGVGHVAAEALVQIGAPAVEPVIAVLGDERRNSDVREAAAETLGKIGDPRAVEPLVIALNDPMRFVREAAAEALDRLAWSPDRNEAGAAYWAARRKWDRCVDIGVPAVEPLIATLRDSLDVAAAAEAAEALGKIGDPRAVQPLVIALNDPTRFFVREAAAEALDRLAWSPDRNEAGAAYWAARRKWDRCVDIGAPAVEPLIATLRKTLDRAADVDDRAAAAEALVQIGAPAVEPLIAALKALITTGRAATGRAARAAAAAAEVLVQIGAPAVEPLVAALKDPEKRVRDAAAATLERMGVPRDQ